MLHEMRLEFTTDSDGDAVATGERGVFGRLIAVIYDRGDMDTGADLTLTFDQYGVTWTLYADTNVGTSDFIIYPRVPVQDAAGDDLTVTEDSPTHEPPLIMGRPSLTVAQGGDTKSGAMILVYEQG